MLRNQTRSPRSGCPIASTLDIVGDRWTLVILRDMLTGKSKFNEFLASPEKITTNVLTDRLSLLEYSGLAKKSAYQQRPLRHEYHLTEKGEALLPVLQEMCRWGNKFLLDTWTPPESFMLRRVAV